MSAPISRQRSMIRFIFRCSNDVPVKKFIVHVVGLLTSWSEISRSAADTAVIIVSIFTLGCVALNTQANKTAYINYTESSEVDYKVYLKENSFRPL